IACAPPTRYISCTPQSDAATSEAGSTLPCASGGVQTTIRGTPAMLAGVANIYMTEGNAPLPLGTYNPTLEIGVIFSPAKIPGAICVNHCSCGSWCSWKVRTLCI